mmetsp:Transcript_22005/g.23985  ORF Transcript_22005/g.23985 Transcript_22005/m.23985 type:complete len:758 (-) Transcript_22005:72-2345(-)
MNNLQYNIHYEWKIIHDGVGKTPNVRASTCSWCYNNALWVVCGASSGLGKGNEVWSFDLRAKVWSKVDTGDSGPQGRDGQAGAYIGEGRFAIFGGQGFPEPNQKLGKESDQMKTQTHWKRDVFNDLWIFDCATLKWSPVYPDGLSFPMGRRGASCIYVRHLSQPMYQSSSADHIKSAKPSSNIKNSLGDDSFSHVSPSVNSATVNGRHTRSALPSHSNTVSAAPPPLENCLVVFGGAGIELSKYTEQLYNDVWAFSFDRNIWIRYDTKGIDPAPTTDHRVHKIDDLMVVMGGIRDTTPKLGQANQFQSPSDVIVLNLMTMTWSQLPVKSVRLNLHGFSAFPDQVFPPSSTVFNAHPQKESQHGRRGQSTPSNTPSTRSQLIVFGGNQVLDTRSAIHSKAMKVLKDRSSQEATLALNVDDCTLSPVLLRGDIFPENRYLHVGISSTPCNYDLNEPGTQQQSVPIDSDTLSVHSQTTAGSRKLESSRKSFLPGVGGIDLRTEEVVGYVFGGSNIETGGYCDPILYALMRVKTIDPLQLRANSAPVSNPTASVTSKNAQNTAKNILQLNASPSFENSASMFDGSVLKDTDFLFASSSGLRGEESSDVREFESSSIWVNIQNKANNYRSKMIQPPNNWEEVKLSLTLSRSQKSLEVLTPFTLQSSHDLGKPTPSSHHNRSSKLSMSRLESKGKDSQRVMSRSSSRQRQEESQRKRDFARQSEALPFIQSYHKLAQTSFDHRNSQARLLLEYSSTKAPAHHK